MFDYNGDYPMLELVWTMLVFFAWFIWFWMVITIFGDIFRRDDAGGGKKAVWIVFIILLPFLGTLVYLITNSKGMSERQLKAQAHLQSQFDQHVRSVAGGSDAAAQIAQAKSLLDSGAITAAEYETLKAKALA